METRESLVSKLGGSIGLSKFALDFPMDNPLITGKLKNLIVECFMATDQEQFKYNLARTIGKVDDKTLESILDIHINQCLKDIERLGINQHIQNIVTQFA